MKDMQMALFSVVFVFIYFNIHLRSCFLSLVGVSLILFSFPLTQVIVQGVFQVTYFGTLQIVVIYIVLGIAADDIFVFVDAWKQSEHMNPEILDDDHKRMSYTWKRAARAMAVTSSTTSVAFFANVFSPIMPIKVFGIFAAVIVPLNYLLVVMFFPSACIFYDRKIAPCFKCCSCFDRKRKGQNAQGDKEG